MAKKTKTQVIDAEVISEEVQEMPTAQMVRSDEEIMTELTGRKKTKELDKVLGDGIKKITPKQKKEVSIINRISEKGEINLSNLTDEEVRMCAKIGSKLDVHDATSISRFGSDLQKVMNDNSKNLLSQTRMYRVGDETQEIINEMMTQIKRVDLGDIKPPTMFVRFMRKIPILKSLVSSIEKFMAEYKTIESTVAEVEKKLEAAQVIALRNNTLLQHDFEDTLKYNAILEKLIIAAKLKYEELNRALEIMKADPSQYSAIEISDVENFRHDLDKKIGNMLTWRTNFTQSLFRIRDIQRANLTLSNDTRDTIQNMMPQFRQQLAQAQALYELSQGVKATQSVKEAFNKVLTQNADAAHDLAVEVAEMSEQSDITMETLEHNQERILATINDVKRCWEEGNQRRKEEEARSAEMIHELEMAAAGIEMSDSVTTTSAEAIEAKYTE